MTIHFIIDLKIFPFKIIDTGYCHTKYNENTVEQFKLIENSVFRKLLSNTNTTFAKELINFIQQDDFLFYLSNFF